MYTESRDENTPSAHVDTVAYARPGTWAETEALAAIDASRDAEEWQLGESVEERRARHRSATRAALLREMGGRHGA